MSFGTNTCFGAPDPPKVRLVKGLTPTHQRALIFYDHETGGFGRTQPVIEWAAIKRLAKGPPYQEEPRTQKVHVTEWEAERMEEKAVEINGFNRDEWEGATNKTDSFANLHDFIASSTIVGFNIDGDLKKLRAEMDGSQIPLVWNWVQPLEMTTLLRAKFPDWGRWNLDEACRRFEIEPEGVHRALGGAERTKQVWDKMLQSV